MRSAADVVKSFAHQAESTATSQQRQAYKVAARHLFDLAAKLERQATAARLQKRRKRAQLELSPDLLSRTEDEDVAVRPARSGTWTAARRTTRSVTLVEVDG